LWVYSWIEQVFVHDPQPVAFVKDSQVFLDPCIHLPLGDHCLDLIKVELASVLPDEVVESDRVEAADSFGLSEAEPEGYDSIWGRSPQV
jgi:hypothetical protein